MIRPRRPLAALLALAAIAVPLACGDDEAAAPATSPTTTVGTTTAGTDCPNVAPPQGETVVPDEIMARGAPTVTAPPAPVTELGITDLIVGDGVEVEKCDVVVAMYTGVGQASKQEFDSSWTTGQPITFPLSNVIEGWQEGLIGMKVNGRRELVIPGSMAYGSQGSPPDIAPDETLAFVIDLVSIYRLSDAKNDATTTTKN
jgi:peptidylprolyl isomerase